MDVDVQLVVGQRTTDPKRLQRYGTASGRSFPTFTDHLLRPHKEDALILKNRATAINITMEGIDHLTDKAETIYSMADHETAIPPPLHKMKTPRPGGQRRYRAWSRGPACQLRQPHTAPVR
ncbi:hypothetical protein [Pseudarthrobacter sp. MDT1-22]